MVVKMSNISISAFLSQIGGGEQHYDKILLSTNVLANLTGNTPSTIATWRCTKQVQIPYIKIGKTVRYRLSDVLKWLKENEIGGCNHEAQ
jgi:hypothetical protein